MTDLERLELIMYRAINRIETETLSPEGFRILLQEIKKYNLEQREQHS